AGNVYMNSNRVDKPGEKVDVESEFVVKGAEAKYVSRGGFKLERSIEHFGLDLSNKIVLDVGASTGGFTDCSLQNGASKVYAVDVGYNQLAWKMRQDERVVVMERTNFRHATPDLFQEGTPNFVTIDVSFISLRLILPAVRLVSEPNSLISALVKPQFEAGKDNVGKKGIVRDPRTHSDVLHDMIKFAVASGFTVSGLTYSGITGGDGNIEFLLLLENTPRNEGELGEVKENVSIEAVVAEAHEVLRKK
ncbi:MAG: TlyA family RNA methyltransferase, partial [Bacilli bacterium]